MIKLLDCTLRDGGYVNNWFFGKENICEIIQQLEKANVDIIEVGFLKNESYIEDRTVFNRIEQITKVISEKKAGTEYAAMIDAMNPIPINQIQTRDNDSIDIIRVMVWKSMHNQNNKIVDCLHSEFEYCKKVAGKGYKLCIQPARVDQYSDSEFVAMVKLFEQLDPLAIYIVDSWGVLNSEQIMHYVMLADSTIKTNIALGYHGHNNLLQAYGTATAFANFDTNRDLFIDASIYGIGRCAGNLNLEAIANYLNCYRKKEYAINCMLYIYERYIRGIRDLYNWGYSVPYFITGRANCHPNYANYLCFEKGMDCIAFEQLINELQTDERVLFSKKTADQYAQNVISK